MPAGMVVPVVGARLDLHFQNGIKLPSGERAAVTGDYHDKGVALPCIRRNLQARFSPGRFEEEAMQLRFGSGVLISLLACGLGTAAHALLLSRSTMPGKVVIPVTARRYRFDPNPIQVRQGQTVELDVTAADHDHGFQIKPMHINELLKKGQTVRIMIPTDRPGVYKIACSHFCGLGHHGMKAKLIVEPASGPPLHG
jgi:cytochrome c oxidase subunit 2